MGSYVAVLDDTGDKHYHVAEVVGMTDQLTYLHYLGKAPRDCTVQSGSTCTITVKVDSRLPHVMKP